MKINRSILNIVIAAILFALIAPVMTYAQEDDEAGGAISIEARRGKGRRDSLRNKLKAATAKVQELQNRTNALLQQLQTQAGTAKEKEAALNQLTANLNELKKQLAAKEKLFTELQAELKSAKEGASQKEKDDAMELGKALEREKTLMKTNEGLVARIVALEKRNKELEEEKSTQRQADSLTFKNNVADAANASDVKASLMVSAYASTLEGGSLRLERKTADLAKDGTETLTLPGPAGKTLAGYFFGRKGTEYQLTIAYKDKDGNAKNLDIISRFNWGGPTFYTENIPDEKGIDLFVLKVSFKGDEIIMQLDNKK